MIGKIFGIYDVLIYNFLKSLKVFSFFEYSLTLFVDFQSLYIRFFWLTSDNRLLVIHFSFFCVSFYQTCKFFRDMFIL